MCSPSPHITYCMHCCMVYNQAIVCVYNWPSSFHNCQAFRLAAKSSSGSAIPMCKDCEGVSKSSILNSVVNSQVTVLLQNFEFSFWYGETLSKQAGGRRPPVKLKTDAAERPGIIRYNLKRVRELWVLLTLSNLSTK